MKINTDGSFSEWGAAWVGGGFRDSSSKCLLFFHALTEAHDALEAELIAVYWALTFALKSAWYKLWIEVDSIQLIIFLNTEQLSSWHHIHWKQKIGNLNKLFKVNMSFIYREGNQPANWLARHDLYTNSISVATRPPTPLALLHHDDKLETSHLRIKANQLKDL
ncbi:uncharacterized protein LOC110033079 [Phalaenopsis equestris]|uniref:uncharacterized protein LOC110033079 n=1 Tax=Phalaenopsis equestris TaxID=78828 RepID=UPI0009E221D4|nr:uncharacterized protein LOC110033079 [Phalaenopsis equestris]